MLEQNNPIVPAKNKPSLYQIAVVLLLAGILCMQVFAQVSASLSRVRSQACVDAIATAQTVSDGVPDQLRALLDDYDSAVYKKADNLPQQTFRAQEYIFLTLQQIAIQNHAIDQMVIACQ